MHSHAPSPHENQLGNSGLERVASRETSVAQARSCTSSHQHGSTSTPALGQVQCNKTQKLGRISHFRSTVGASSQSPVAGLHAKVVVFVRLRSTWLPPETLLLPCGEMTWPGSPGPASSSCPWLVFVYSSWISREVCLWTGGENEIGKSGGLALFGVERQWGW